MYPPLLIVVVLLCVAAAQLVEQVNVEALIRLLPLPSVMAMVVPDPPSTTHLIPVIVHVAPVAL